MLKHNQIIEFARRLPGSLAVTGAQYRVDLQWTTGLVRLTETGTGHIVYEESGDLTAGLMRGTITHH